VPLESVFNGFGCEGQNRSLALEWTPVEGAQSYAVVIHDPDAPTGVGFFHWIAVDLPAGTTSIPAGASGSAMPAGVVETYTDFGANGYGGRCPPPGTPHRYEVTVYAVDVPSLGVPAGATGALVRFMLRSTGADRQVTSRRSRHAPRPRGPRRASCESERAPGS
jgi:Raf kinase inhibitor-like YbhB/YbcL family protein